VIKEANAHGHRRGLNTCLDLPHAIAQRVRIASSLITVLQLRHDSTLEL
jgi:hypothetical protein